ncbi:hypothetical protein ACFL1U_02300 [Patescibacteria group bacterium]
MKRTNLTLNIIIYVIVACLLVGAILFFTWEPLRNYYPVPNMTGIGALLSCFLICAPIFAYALFPGLRRKYRIELILFLQIILAIVVSLNALGALKLYLDLPAYDTFVHFYNTFLAVIILYVLLHAWRGVRGEKFVTTWKHALAALAGAAILAIFWEFYELLSDPLLGVQQFGQPGEPLDTFYDSVGNGVGIFLAGALMWWKGVPFLARYNNFRK